MIRLIFAILSIILLVFNIWLWMWTTDMFATGMQGAGLSSALGLLLLFGTGCANLLFILVAIFGIGQTKRPRSRAHHGPSDWSESVSEKYGFATDTNWQSPHSAPHQDYAPKRRRKKSGWKIAIDLIEDVVEEIFD